MKKIETEQLQLGMYVARLCGSWLANPFWRRSLLLETEAQLAKLRASGIRHVMIDPQRGADIAPSAPAAAPPPPARAATAAASADPGEALRHAAGVISQSKRQLCAMFTEARMGKLATLEQALPLVDEISASVLGNPGALLGLARLRSADDYTYMHSVAVCALMIALGRQLGLDAGQLRSAGLAGLLHDIGKMAVPLEVLNKPGKLSEAEFGVVRGHPAAGHRLLQEAGISDPVVLDVCLHHHEKLDGSGYPQGLRGKSLSLQARMGAVCDVYDAITSNRPYKAGWCPSQSLRKMAEWSQGHFDPAVFAAFVKCLGIYPPGTLVRLSSERLAVVLAQGRDGALLQPSVKVIYCIRRGSEITPELLDLSLQGGAGRLSSTIAGNLWEISPVVLSVFWVWVFMWQVYHCASGNPRNFTVT